MEILIYTPLRRESQVKQGADWTTTQALCFQSSVLFNINAPETEKEGEEDEGCLPRLIRMPIIESIQLFKCHIMSAK